MTQQGEGNTRDSISTKLCNSVFLRRLINKRK